MDLSDVGSGRFTWRRLKAYVDGMRYVRDSAFWNEQDPQGHRLWTVDTYLLAGVVDALNVANWQRSEDATKGKNKPKPVPRPSDRVRESSKAETLKELIAQRKQRRARPRRVE